MRLFYAISLPTELQMVLGEAQKKLRGNWRTVRQDQLHITLAFMPQVPSGKLSELVALGNAVGKAHAPFSARLRGTGYFPGAGSPRVWFVKAESDGDTLERIAADLRAGLTVPSEAQAFKAHVTLARKKGPAPRLEPMLFGQGWPITGFTLIESTLHKSGPEYRIVKRFKLLGTPTQTAENAPPTGLETLSSDSGENSGSSVEITPENGV